MMPNRSRAPVKLIAALTVFSALFVFGNLPSLGFYQLRAGQWGGTVRSVGGEPLKLVWVQELGSWNGSLTKADGRFLLPSGKATTLLFDKPGYRPKLRTLGGSEAQADWSITLEPEGQAALDLRSCQPVRSGSIHQIKLAPVRGLKIKRGREVDFAAFSAMFTYQGAVAYISGSNGIHVAGMTPTPDWSDGVSSLSVQSVKCGGDYWFDLRGSSPGGLESRWVGYAFAHVEYSKVAAPVARVLDKSIDGGCCR